MTKILILLTSGKKTENPRMYKFLAEFRLIYCSAEKPKIFYFFK